jgi:hypothetical protein
MYAITTTTAISSSGGIVGLIGLIKSYHCHKNDNDCCYSTVSSLLGIVINWCITINTSTANNTTPYLHCHKNDIHCLRQCYASDIDDYCYSSIVCIITICISIDPIDNTIACIIMYCKIRIETNVNWE